MSDYPMLISNKLHSFRNFIVQNYNVQKHHAIPIIGYFFVYKVAVILS